MRDETWRALAAGQEGLLARRQLRAIGFDRSRIRNQIAAERWVALSDNVVATTTGTLTRTQTRWLGVLHAGPTALIGDLTAAEVHGLRNWSRDDVTVLIPQRPDIDEDVAGVRFVRTRRPLPTLRDTSSDLPVCRIEPAVLHFAAYRRSRRTAQGLMAAAVQQGLASPASLLMWVDRMRPLRRARLFRQVLGEIAGGAQSLAEIDVGRMCRDAGLAAPARQIKRRDSSGRARFTDCEWRLPDGRTVVLEVDGSFHMDVEHWEADLARQRALSAALGVPGSCP